MSRGIQSGEFKERVELQNFVETKDKTGGPTRAWSTAVTRWAKMEPARGQEKFEAQQMEARTDVVISIRYYADIDTTWRVKRGTKIYNIESIVNVGENDYVLELHCTQNKGRQDGG